MGRVQTIIEIIYITPKNTMLFSALFLKGGWGENLLFVKLRKWRTWSLLIIEPTEKNAIRAWQVKASGGIESYTGAARSHKTVHSKIWNHIAVRRNFNYTP
jgi:hypothetical protein